MPHPDALRFRIPAFARLLIALPLCASCSTGSPTKETAVRDSAGVFIVETAAPTAEWRLSPEPVLQIGVVEGADAYQFSSIAFTGRLSDGRVVAVDRQSLEIRFFDPAGKHVSTLGGRGAGPGEFRQFTHVALAGDSLLVYDAGNRRLVLIGPDAAVLKEQSIRGHPAFASFGLDHNVIGLTAAGRMVVAFPPAANPPAVPNAAVYGRDTLAILDASLDGTTVDTVARVPGGEYLFRDAASSGIGPAGPGRARSGWSRSGVTFGYYPYYTLTSAGLVYASGERSGFEVLRLSRAATTGRTVRIVRRTDASAVRVADVISRYAEWAGEGSADPSQAISRARARLAVLPSDHLVPFIDDMLADSEGRIWQRDHLMPWEPDETPRSWIVYSADGHALARIVIPGNYRITQVGAEHIVGVSRDEMDVPSVAIYRILR